MLGLPIVLHALVSVLVASGTGPDLGAFSTSATWAAVSPGLDSPRAPGALVAVSEFTATNPSCIEDGEEEKWWPTALASWPTPPRRWSDPGESPWAASAMPSRRSPLFLDLCRLRC